MGATTGSFGQPNYLPTQGTGQNPSVSIGFGMEPPEFQEGYETQSTDLNQYGAPPLTTQQMPVYQTQQQPITQGNGALPPGFGALSPIDRSQINPSASIGFGGFGGGKSAPMAAPQPASMTGPGNPFGNQLMGGMGSLVTQPAPNPGPGQLVGGPAPIQRPGNRFIPPMAPGASARRPIPGFQFPGQRPPSLPRQPVVSKPQYINRLRNRLI